MDELKMTVESLIELDEPEALLATLRRAAARRHGARWQALAKALGEAEDRFDMLLKADDLLDEKTSDSEAKTE